MPRSWSEAVKQCRKHPRKGANGRWCSCPVGWRYRLGIPDEVTGRPGPAEWSQTFPTKRAADEHQRATRQAIADKVFIRDRGLTVGEFLTQWLAGKERAGRKLSTIDGYRSVIDIHLIPNLGAHRLGDLTPRHVQAMLDRLAAGPSKRRGKGAARSVTAGTIANVRAVLRAALADAMRQQLVIRNVATLVTLPPIRRKPAVAIPADRLTKFLRYADRVRDPLAVLWLLESVYGLRRAELLALRWDDIDQTTELIVVRQTLTEVDGDHPCPYCGATHRRLLFGTPKSIAGERCYPLVPPVAVALVDQRQRQGGERELYGGDYADHRLVFAQSDGNPWRPEWVSHEFKRLMRASGAAENLAAIPPLKSMRSTSVTRLHEKGVPLEVVSRQTGHASEAVTRDHYLVITAERTRRQYGAIAKKLAPRRSDLQSDLPTKTVYAELGGGRTS